MAEDHTKQMDTYRAVMLAEGVEDGDENEVLEAWQYLVDSGVVWQLQGTFGRTASNMIAQGLIMPAPLSSLH